MPCFDKQGNGLSYFTCETIVVTRVATKKTIDAIQKAAYTGETGDGKIFSYEIKSALKIRTKETGYDAIQASD